VQADFSPHEFNQLARNGRAQPGSAETPGGGLVRLGKALEDACLGL